MATNVKLNANYYSPDAEGDGGDTITIDDTVAASLVAAGLAEEVSATGVVESEAGIVVKQVTVTLDDCAIVLTDAGANGSHGTQLVKTFAAGPIQILGCSMNLTTKAGAGGIGDTAALIGALGSASVTTANETLTSTEADLIASTSGTLSGGAGTLANHGSLVATAFDGHTTAIKAYLNLVCPNADSSATDTVTVNGTIKITYANLGDY